MKKNKLQGFDYYLSEETVKRYREKPLELRLQWLYMGNLLRKHTIKELSEYRTNLERERYKPGKRP